MIQRKHIVFYLALSVISLAIYQLWSGALYRPGFPLDDAWIHQTYARNLAEQGIWSFQEGLPSAGSTAPLWTAALSIGYLLQITPLAWNFFLGVLILTGIAVSVARGIAYFIPDQPSFARIAGGLLIFEWHLVWAAGSGMETLLFAWIVLYLLIRLLRDEGGTFLWGMLIGIAVWLRPDGITLIGPVFFVLALREGALDYKIRELIKLFLGIILLLGPYAVFNTWLSGEMLPSTFFAKQAEYAVLRSLPFGSRLRGQLLVPIVGAGAAALPGLALAFRRGIKKRDLVVWAGLFWVFGIALLYAIRLPVTYQHGRYLIPVVPVWLVWGLGPLAAELKLQTEKLWPRVLSRSWLLLFVSIMFVFYFIGARTFAWDVAVIESEMVETAEWVQSNLSHNPEIRIAAHDIGALGYFGKIPLVDMAGLVSPAAIPIIRDEAALADFLDDEAVAYLITLEGWYPELENGLRVLYRTDSGFSPAIGGTNMVVYIWEPD